MTEGAGGGTGGGGARAGRLGALGIGGAGAEGLLGVGLFGVGGDEARGVGEGVDGFGEGTVRPEMEGGLPRTGGFPTVRHEYIERKWKIRHTHLDWPYR